MSKEDEKKVESAMPVEDAEEQKPQGSFVKAEPTEKGPSPLQIMLYQAKKLKDIDDKLAILIEQQMKGTPVVEAKPAKTAETQSVPQSKSGGIEDVKMLFPENLEVLLAFSEKDGYILIKPRQFLGSENFAKISSVIRAVGGEYVSAGKDSHFRISSSKVAKAKPAMTSQQKTAEQPKIEGEPPKLVAIKKGLGDLLKLVAIDTTSSATMYVVKPKEFLGKETFGKLASVVRNLGGTYVSQGRESHFDIPKNA